ncbi:hypothetical protein GJ744_009748 [Endocarpon pusillum]|uniref:Uncharacterized protein n=1 Tax=Endocarpon pusillum TaxID=364733 RepID=A0A8H7E8M8_9EURO|nr:hypothetical protein GJ744_009748 [Endocarpon pusillum]
MTCQTFPDKTPRMSSTPGESQNHPFHRFSPKLPRDISGVSLLSIPDLANFADGASVALFDPIII